MKKTKIVFLGLGGVGGYYGGKLAKHNSGYEKAGVYFIARGEHLKAVRKSGIHIITEQEDFFAKPEKATDTPSEIGVADYVIIATKSYDLKSSVEYMQPCIGRHTVILPLLNGGDITERIREILPGNTVWSGCSYIVSRRTEPGVIRVSGTLSKLLFGYDKGKNEQLVNFEKLLREADIDAHLSENIRESVWRKFFFISVTASLTSYFDVGFNELIDAEERLNMTVGMAEEFLQVAKAEGVDLGENAVEQILNRAEALPRGATTSMHSDFKAGNNTEVETLTGVVVKLARKHLIDVPIYETVYKELKRRQTVGA